ncbi:hypothetical protein ANCCAN_00596 [Ancylostoma caninum]|uniref:Uncharacterized protein n=1 Tax=Ancylostoma caninum TaxID=29170 RepID=A0A368HCK8_ANCCA|nr:hypothetical protein ANCCAN_00596 [Ancylostoma caninum]
MADRIQHYERMMRYIQHRERVLDMQSVVKQQIRRSRSTPPRKNPLKEADAKRRIDLENERLMQSLISIATRPSEYRKPKRRSKTPASAQRRPSKSRSG